MAFSNEYTLKVDIKRSTSNVVPTFKQGDNAILKFLIFDNGKAYDLTSFTNAEITFRTPSGDVVIGNPVLEDGLIVYELTSVEMEKVGIVTVILTLNSGDTNVSIQPFNIFIYDSMKTENLSYIGILQELIAETQQVELNALSVISDMNTTMDALELDASTYKATLVQDVTDYKTEVDNFNAQRIHKKDWNSTVQYVINNEVLYNGSTFRALRNNLGVVPIEGLDWTLISRKGSDGSGTVDVHKETFVATEGQKVFNTQNRFDQFQNRATVTVNGVQQRTPENYDELSSTQIAFNEGLPAGYVVEITYFGEAIPLSDDVRTVVTNHTNEINKFNNQGIYEETFVATDNQTVFTLTTTTYEPLQHKIEVFVEGIKQDSGDNFTESSSSTITLTEGVPAGTEVVVKYYGRRIPVTTDVEATLNNHASEITNHTTEISTLTKQLADIVILMSSFSRLAPEITDTQRIQRAVDYCIANGIGNLHFNKQAENYIFSSRVSIKNANNLLITQDKGVKLQFANDLTTTHYSYMLLFEVEKSKNVKFDGIFFYGNKEGQTSPHATPGSFYSGIEVSGSEIISITNCQFDNFFGQAIKPVYEDLHTNPVADDYALMSQRKGVWGITISGNRFNDVQGASQFICADHKDIKITNNILDGFNEHGFTFYPYAKEILISGNTIRNGGRVSGLLSNPIRIYENDNVVISDNIIDGYNQAGIIVDTNNLTRICKNVTIHHNIVKNFVGGGDVYVSGINAVADNLTIDNNILENTGYYGMQVSGKGIAINNNVFKSNSYMNLIIGRRDAPAYDDITITGNSISNATQNNVGVYFSKSIPNLKIANNTIQNTKRKIQSATSQFILGEHTFNGNHTFANITGNNITFKSSPIVMPKKGRVMGISYNVIGDFTVGDIYLEMYVNGTKKGVSKAVKAGAGFVNYPYGQVDDSVDALFFNEGDVIEFSVRPFNTDKTYTIDYNYLYGFI